MNGEQANNIQDKVLKEIAEKLKEGIYRPLPTIGKD